MATDTPIASAAHFSQGSWRSRGDRTGKIAKKMKKSGASRLMASA